MKNYLLLLVALFLFNSCDNEKGSAMHPDFVLALHYLHHHCHVATIISPLVGFT